MGDILATAKTVCQLLKGVKYSIDYYQREYQWRDKQVQELVHDLSCKFLEEFEPGHARNKVAEYARYFLGSIIISKKDHRNYVVDGQQRLTTVTLLLVLLRHLQRGIHEPYIDDLIVSTMYGQKSFNLDVAERAECMDALYEGRPYNASSQSESVQNLANRYQDLETCFPNELRDKALPYFADWLLHNVHMVEIAAYSDDDAYTIFETMNDRGLSLTPTDMLKGYLLANITDPFMRMDANSRWRARTVELKTMGKEVEPDALKAWLRSQYATKIREKRKGAHPEDFDRLGTEFHRWLREASYSIGLRESDDFYRFIQREYEFYTRQYIRLVEASQSLVQGLEPVFYNAQLGFTQQYMVLLAPLRPDEGETIASRKIRLVARYIDILLARRLWNFRTLSYSAMQYPMFRIMKDIRGLDVPALQETLLSALSEEKETFLSNDRLRVHVLNRYFLHRMLARITDYVETQSGQPSRYAEYVSTGPGQYEVEHIWADRPDRHAEEFPHPADFKEYRDRIGGLILLPKPLNASYRDLPYQEKLHHYNSQNLLARSLHPHCYSHNPGFLHFVRTSGLPFRPYEEFPRAALDERSVLYRQLAERVWTPELLRETTA